MNRYYKGLLLVFFLVAGSIVGATESIINVIPRPAKLEMKTRSFEINEKTAIVARKELKNKAQQLAGFLRPATGFALPLKEGKGILGRSNFIELKLDDSLNLASEAYKLSSDSKGVVISASQAQGIFNGIQTLRQLLPEQIFREAKVNGVEWKVPALDIEDSPRFGWRGLMVDSSRTFWSVKFMKKYIDLLALYKMNVLHMHLVDDQGWRLEIKKYPQLTEKGAFFPKKYNEPKEREGFYTQDDIREIVTYAAARNITVVPEIEMPGHCIAMLNVFPELSCTGKPHEIHTFFKGPGIHPDIMCAGNDKTFEVLEDIFDEVFELFPSKYIHVGGDEAPKSRWHKCPKCKQRLKSENLKNEHHMQSWFIAKMEKYINKHGRKIIGWTEILHGGLPQCR